MYIYIYIYIIAEVKSHLETSQTCFNRHGQRLEFETGYENNRERRLRSRRQP